MTSFLEPLNSSVLLRANMVHTLTVLRGRSADLMRMMEVFISEPLLDWEMQVTTVICGYHGYYCPHCHCSFHCHCHCNCHCHCHCHCHGPPSPWRSCSSSGTRVEGRQRALGEGIGV